ncbi:MAG: hypothetical protein HY608_01320 [Planctomycetes bacterium]|nr:hypothetical protein [Planctomycetota bacterium]
MTRPATADAGTAGTGPVPGSARLPLLLLGTLLVTLPWTPARILGWAVYAFVILPAPERGLPALAVWVSFFELPAGTFQAGFTVKPAQGIALLISLALAARWTRLRTLPRAGAIERLAVAFLAWHLLSALAGPAPGTDLRLGANLVLACWTGLLVRQFDLTRAARSRILAAWGIGLVAGCLLLAILCARSMREGGWLHAISRTSGAVEQTPHACFEGDIGTDPTHRAFSTYRFPLSVAVPVCFAGLVAQGGTRGAWGGLLAIAWTGSCALFCKSTWLAGLGGSLVACAVLARPPHRGAVLCRGAWGGAMLAAIGVATALLLPYIRIEARKFLVPWNPSSTPIHVVSWPEELRAGDPSEMGRLSWLGEIVYHLGSPRYLALRTCGAHLAAHPLFGLGAGSQLRAELGLPPHNLYIHVAVTAGIPAALLLIGIQAAYAIAFLRAARADPWASAAGLGLLAAWGIHSFFEVTYHAFLGWFLLSLLSIPCRDDQPEPAPDAHPR